MINTYRYSLQKQFTYTLGGFAIFVAMLIGLFGVYLNEQFEVEIWRATLESEFLSYTGNNKYAKQPVVQHGNLHIYKFKEGVTLSQAIPKELHHLKPGIYDEIQIGDRDYSVLIRDLDTERILLMYDITHLEKSEFNLGILVVGLILISIIGIIYLSHLLGQMLVAPIKNMADKVGGLNPMERGLRMDYVNKENELATIADAINSYLIRLDHYVDHEREFLDTVSHELRTPITIISGAVDILSTHPESKEITERALLRLKQATKDMVESINALFILAKDGTQIANSAEPFRFDTLIEKIIKDHLAVFSNKLINIHATLNSTCIFAPKEAAAIVLRNLIRNSIEHSKDYEITIKLEHGVLQIENRGRHAAPEQAALLFNKRVRDEGGAGSGLGLYLIKRVCENLKWVLEITGLEKNLFLVRLDLSQYVVNDIAE